LSYAKNLRLPAYALALALFTLGLLAKPMLVTVPFLLLLLDYWPLRRISLSPDSRNEPATLKRVWWEKAPFFALAGADCVITYWVQSQAGSVASLEHTPMIWRMINIPIAYLTYLEKAFWPVHLGILYSFPKTLPVLPALVSSALLLLGTAVAWHYRLKFRWLGVGWFWFLGTLVPVIGVVQTGAQSWADRHAYVPLLGLFLVAGCGLNELWRARPAGRNFIGLGAAVVLSACLLLTRQQISYWRDSVALFTQAVDVNPANAAAQNQLGKAFNGQGQTSEAVEHFALAVQIEPQTDEYQYNLGRALIDAGQFARAIGPLETALKGKPDDAVLHNTLGVALMQSGRPHDADREFSHAITLEPDYAKSYFNLGKSLLKEGQPKPAITNFLVALRLESDWVEAEENLAAAYDAAGDSAKAIATASLALTMAETNNQPNLAREISAELQAYKTGSVA
jgi:Flp pilus assembly protein TadD